MASKTNPFTFLQQVRAEASKITWPSRRETMISTAMVLVMVIFAALFFFAADQLIGWLLSLVLNAGVIAATMTTGWHYFTDVVGGAVLAVGVIAITTHSAAAMHETSRRMLHRLGRITPPSKRRAVEDAAAASTGVRP